MQRHLHRALGVLVAAALGFTGTDVQAMDARREPARVAPTSLGAPRPEAPAAPDVDPSACAACRLAQATTGRLAPDAVAVQTQLLPDGIALYLRARDAFVREQLWSAVVARGELLDALHAGADVSLCSSCRARRHRLDGLQMAMHRAGDGVLLVYTSALPHVVHDLQRVLVEPGLVASF